MLRDALLFVGGALALLWLPAAVPVPAPLLPVLLCACCLSRRLRRAAPLLAGALLANLAVTAQVAGQPSATERLLVDAQVLSLPRQLPDGWQFDARLTFPRDPARHAALVRTTWRGAAVRPVRAGEHWRLAVTLRPPGGTANPGVPDAARNLFRDHVQGLAQVLASPLNVRTAAARPGLLSLRERLANHIGSAVSDPAAGALLAALAVGATAAVQPDQWRVFNATGITHLVAISGMHVTVFAVTAMALARRLWRFAARRGFRWRREPCAVVAGLLLATGYALLAGFSVPTQRTLVMLAAWLGFRVAGRAARPSTSVAVALVAVVAWDPMALLSAGFWLSFLAVGAIIAFVGCRIPAPTGLRAAVAVQCAVAVALLPVSLAIFDGYSLAGLFVNVAAIPLFSWLLVPPVLIATGLLVVPLPGFEVLAQWLLLFAGRVAVLAWPWLGAAADLPLALVQAVPPPAWYPLAALAVLLALLPWAPRLRVLALSCLVPLALDVRRVLPPGASAVEVLDVGRGLAVLVETRGHALLFGTGETFGSGGRVVERTVVAVARARGIRRLDRVVAGRLTGDAGHGVTAAHAFLGSPMLAATPMPGRLLAPEFIDCAALADWDWDGVGFRPLRGAAGCSLSIRVDGTSLLLVDPAASGDVASQVAVADVLVAAKPPRLPEGETAAAGTFARLRRSSGGFEHLSTATVGAVRVVARPGEAVDVAQAREGRWGRWSRVVPRRAGVATGRPAVAIRYDAAPCGKSSVLAASSCGRSSSAP